MMEDRDEKKISSKLGEARTATFGCDEGGPETASRDAWSAVRSYWSRAGGVWAHRE